jgi:hypothetical protein
MRILALIFGLTALCVCAQVPPVTQPSQSATNPPERHDGSGGLLVRKGIVAGKGDLGQFIMQTAIHFGKKPPVTNDIPAVSVEWRYTEFYGSHDIEILLSSQSFPQVKSFLDQFFGPPYFKRDGKDKFYSYGFTKPVNGGAIHIFVANIDGQDTMEISIHPP